MCQDKGQINIIWSYTVQALSSKTGSYEHKSAARNLEIKRLLMICNIKLICACVGDRSLAFMSPMLWLFDCVLNMFQNNYYKQ